MKNTINGLRWLSKRGTRINKPASIREILARAEKVGRDKADNGGGYELRKRNQ